MRAPGGRSEEPCRSLVCAWTGSSAGATAVGVKHESLWTSPADVNEQGRHTGHLVATQVSNAVTIVAEADHNILSGAHVLEALVYLADPQAECRQIAVRALQVYGSVGAVLSARVPDLTTKLGIRQNVACALKAVHTAMCLVLNEPLPKRVTIGSLAQLIDYVSVSLKDETVELLRMLYLDRKNGLISDEDVNRSTVGAVPICPRAVVRRALELGASAVIVAHSHPSGDSTPSEVDVSFSQQVHRALSTMNIVLHDSVIVGKGGVASLRSLGHL
jgi:DNA repair protein RadC